MIKIQFRNDLNGCDPENESNMVDISRKRFLCRIIESDPFKTIKDECNECNECNEYNENNIMCSKNENIVYNKNNDIVCGKNDNIKHDKHIRLGL
jgi:hypothetical protein